MLSEIFPIFCLGCKKYDQFICSDCAKTACLSTEQQRESFSFRAGFRYEGLISEALSKVKQHNQFGYLKVLGRLVSQRLKPSHDYVCLVPPSTNKAFRKRGFNPSYELAKFAGFKVSGAIRRVKQTDYQQGLDYQTRQINIDNAFRVNRGGSYFLFDDVITTGATTREMIRAVEKAGGEVRGIFALCSTSTKGAN